jgi:hypothetical protein
MIVHTLIFSFDEGRTQAEQDKFLATVADQLEVGPVHPCRDPQAPATAQRRVCSGIRRVGGRAVVLP